MDTLLLLILLLAAVIVVALLVAGMRRSTAQTAASDEARLQRAFPYAGMIVGFEEVGEGRDSRGAYRVLDFAFEIQPPGEAPYQTRTSWKVYGRGGAGLQLGRTVAIKVDLDDSLIVYPDMPGVEYAWARAQAVQRR